MAIVTQWEDFFNDKKPMFHETIATTIIGQYVRFCDITQLVFAGETKMSFIDFDQIF
jgi:hypothetical protein